VAGDFIYPHELALLVVWLCAPAVITTVPILLWLFARRGLLSPSRRARALFCVFMGVLGTLVLSVPLWVSLPLSVVPPEIGGSSVPPFFMPSFIAALIVMPLVYWWAVRAASAKDKSRVFRA
jgi:hypothetical protein